MGKMGSRALTERQQQIINILQGYSYNAYEVCRILNGKPFRAFQKCFYRFESKCRGNRCRMKRNHCQIRSNSVDATLRTLWKRKIISSIKLRWFDGRPTGKNAHGICTDVFRFYYITKRSLAARLKDDIKRVLESPPSNSKQKKE